MMKGCTLGWSGQPNRMQQTTEHFFDGFWEEDQPFIRCSSITEMFHSELSPRSSINSHPASFTFPS